MKRIKGFADMSSTVKSLLLVAVLAVQGVSASWVSTNFVRKGPVVTADSTANNIVGSTTPDKTALVVQGRTGSTVPIFKVTANGTGSRFEVNTNGTTVCGGGFQMVYNAVTPAASPGTSLPVTRGVVNVAGAASASRHVYLPAASSCTPGQVFYIWDGGGSGATQTITVNRNATPGTDTINGAASKTITTAYGGLMVVNLTSSSFVAVSLVAAP